MNMAVVLENTWLITCYNGDIYFVTIKTRKPVKHISAIKRNVNFFAIGRILRLDNFIARTNIGRSSAKREFIRARVKSHLDCLRNIGQNADAADGFGELLNADGCDKLRFGIQKLSVANVPGEFGGFLHTAGLTYEVHTYIPSGVVLDENGMFVKVEGDRRIQNVLVNGEPIDPEKTYTLASHDYKLLNMGDGYSMFADNVVLQDRVMLDNQVLINYITNVLGGTIPEKYADPYGEGRITFVTEAPAN